MPHTRNCIECLGFETGPFKGNCSKACSHLNFTSAEKLDKNDCRVKNHKGCWMSFKMTEQDGFDKYFVTILNKVGKSEKVIAQRGRPTRTYKHSSALITVPDMNQKDSYPKDEQLMDNFQGPSRLLLEDLNNEGGSVFVCPSMGPNSQP